jgi:hypothetical protein
VIADQIINALDALIRGGHRHTFALLKSREVGSPARDRIQWSRERALNRFATLDMMEDVIRKLIGSSGSNGRELREPLAPFGWCPLAGDELNSVCCPKSRWPLKCPEKAVQSIRVPPVR